jgi:hypothetical protein
MVGMLPGIVAHAAMRKRRLHVPDIPTITASHECMLARMVYSNVLRMRRSESLHLPWMWPERQSSYECDDAHTHVRTFFV